MAFGDLVGVTVRKYVLGDNAVEEDYKGDSEEHRHEYVIDDIENGGCNSADVARSARKSSSRTEPY